MAMEEISVIVESLLCFNEAIWLWRRYSVIGVKFAFLQRSCKALENISLIFLMKFPFLQCSCLSQLFI